MMAIQNIKLWLSPSLGDRVCFLLTQSTANKIKINLTSGLNPDKFPIHKDLVPPCVYDHRMLYEHHIG
jgi:hypothetical protein